MSRLSPGRESILSMQRAKTCDARQPKSPARTSSSASALYMVKEIYDQPSVVGQTLAQYIDIASGTIKMPKAVELNFRDINRVSITACGTAFYAGLIARYWFERYAGLPVDIDVASEFRYP